MCVYRLLIKTFFILFVDNFLLKTANKGSLLKKGNERKGERQIKTREYCCDECGKTFVKNSSLKEHIQTIHEDNLPFICDLCGYTNRKLVNLSNHMKSKHMQLEHVCLICGQAFVAKGVLKNHLLLHSYDKKFECKLCGKQFAQNAGLLIHLAQTHKQKTYPCSDCGKIYKSYHRLYQHRYVHEGERATQAKKKFVCEICGWNAFTAQTLENHKVKHTKEKPFSCDICGSEFGWMRALNFHKKKLHAHCNSVDEWKVALRTELTQQANLQRFSTEL